MRVGGYRSILRPQRESNHDSLFVRPEAHSQYSSYVYGTCCELAKYRLSALRQGAPVGQALHLRLLRVRQLATTRTTSDNRPPRFKLLIYVTHKFHSWGSEPMEHVFVSCIHFICTVIPNVEKNSYISLTTCHPSERGPVLCHMIMVWRNAVQSPCCNQHEQARCSVKGLPISILNTQNVSNVLGTWAPAFRKTCCLHLTF